VCVCVREREWVCECARETYLVSERDIEQREEKTHFVQIWRHVSAFSVSEDPGDPGITR
jgi:hypothetical protein